MEAEALEDDHRRVEQNSFAITVVEESRRLRNRWIDYLRGCHLPNL